jgi:hypothetical protein
VNKLEEILKKASEANPKKDLEELYFSGFLKGYWDLYFEPGHAYYSEAAELDSSFKTTIEVIEKKVFENVLDSEGCYETEEFQNALKRWNVIQDSPLMKALK